MHRDFVPYYVRVGDSWTKIDYSKKPEEWMKPLVRGEETDLVEIPASWYLDDLPPMMFIKGAPNSHGFVNPRHLEEIWRDQFDYVYREEDYAVFGMTIHPDVSGRPQVILMLERLIEYISGHDGVRWATMDEIADDFKDALPEAELIEHRGTGVQRLQPRLRTDGCLSPPRPQPALRRAASIRRRRGRRRRRTPRRSCTGARRNREPKREHDQDETISDSGHRGRRRAERVEVRADRPARRTGADQDRQRLGFVAVLRAGSCGRSRSRSA